MYCIFLDVMYHFTVSKYYGFHVLLVAKCKDRHDSPVATNVTGHLQPGAVHTAGTRVGFSEMIMDESAAKVALCASNNLYMGGT